MKKKDLLLLGAVCLLALGFFIFYQTFFGGDNTLVRITVDGELYQEYSLHDTAEIKINDTNTCVIENNKVHMTEASCPDQICVNQGEIGEEGGAIVCLPNRVVIETVKGEG